MPVQGPRLDCFHGAQIRDRLDLHRIGIEKDLDIVRLLELVSVRSPEVARVTETEENRLQLAA